MKFRFPYPPLQTIALVAVVGFAMAHTLYTRNRVYEVAANVGRPPSDEARLLVWSMFGITVALTLFIAGALWYRARLGVVIEDDALVLERLHWRASSRRVELPWSRIDRVWVRRSVRGQWHAFVEHGTDRHKLPLHHAVCPGDRGRVAVRDEDDARAHPLVDALREHLGERVEITR